MTARSRSPRVRFVRSNTKAILRSERSSAARKAQVADVDMATKMYDIRVTDLWNNEPAFMVQPATNPPMTDGHAVFFPEIRRR